MAMNQHSKCDAFIGSENGVISVRKHIDNIIKCQTAPQQYKMYMISVKEGDFYAKKKKKMRD